MTGVGRPLLAAGLCALSLALAGCDQGRASEARALVSALGVEAHGGRLTWVFVLPNVTATAANVSNLSPANQVYLVQVQAPDWATAVARLGDQLSRDPYLGELEVVALSQHLSAQQVTALLSSLNRDDAVPKSFWLVATSSDVAGLLTLPTHQEVVPRYYLESYFSCGTCHPLDWRVQGWQWWCSRASPGISALVPLAKVQNAAMVVAGVAVYPPAGPPLTLAGPALEGLAYLTGRATKESLYRPAPGPPIAIRDLRLTARHRAWLDGSAVAAEVHLEGRGLLTQAGEGLAPVADVPGAERWAAEAILERCLEAVRWANATGTDPFGFTRDALQEVPRVAYALPGGAVLWRPLRVRVTVQLHLDASGT